MTYTEAYQKYYPKVLRICKRILEDEHVAKDAAQETMFKMMQKWDTLDKKESLGAWLSTTTRNACIDIIRKRKREVPLEEIPQAEFFEEDPGKLLMEEAREIVLKLPSIYQEIFHLSFIRGYTGQQIADRLCIPLSTVKTRVRVCLQKIQAAL